MPQNPENEDEFEDIDSALFPDEISGVIEQYLAGVKEEFNDEVFYIITEKDKLLSYNFSPEEKQAILGYITRRLTEIGDIFLSMQ